MSCPGVLGWKNDKQPILGSRNTDNESVTPKSIIWMLADERDTN